VTTWTDPDASPDELDALRQILNGEYSTESQARLLDDVKRHNERVMGNGRIEKPISLVRRKVLRCL
jgi:hypothetical protein